MILDFVPVHFAVDDYALRNYDGTPLYEYPDSAAGGSEWGSCNFIHSRGEVRSFLQSAALYWLREFHADGLRMDAVSNLIYWQGDPARGENRDGICFLQQMNRGLKYRELPVLHHADTIHHNAVGTGMYQHYPYSQGETQEVYDLRLQLVICHIRMF